MSGYKPNKIHLKGPSGEMACNQHIQTSVYDFVNPPLIVTDKPELITCGKCKKLVERRRLKC